MNVSYCVYLKMLHSVRHTKNKFGVSWLFLVGIVVAVVARPLKSAGKTTFFLVDFLKFRVQH